MDRYKDNAKWLKYFAPFSVLAISAAYITPFFLQRGLSLSQIFLLQTIFSVAFLLWEIPSGWIADKFGRALCIKVSTPIVGISFIFYGLSRHFWQFAVEEFALALGEGLISGITTALLLDSLNAEGEEKEFVEISQKINALGFAAGAVGVPIAILLVRFVSIGSTLVADGVLSLIGTYFAFKLVDPPTQNGKQEQIILSSWVAMKELTSNVEARWLVLLGAVLSMATYLAFWLSASYYESMGIPVVAFAVILAVRNLWKAGLSHFVKQQTHIERNMIVYATLAGAVYFGMATGRIWFVWVVLGHDVVQALAGQPLTARINLHIGHDYRATLNSMVTMIQRLMYSIVGPLIGLFIDWHGLKAGFVLIGLSSSLVSFVAIIRLHQLKTFNERR